MTIWNNNAIRIQPTDPNREERRGIWFSSKWGSTIVYGCYKPEYLADKPDLEKTEKFTLSCLRREGFMRVGEL